MIVPIGGIGQNTASKYMLNPYDNKPKKVICNFANWAGLRQAVKKLKHFILILLLATLTKQPQPPFILRKLYILPML